MSRCICLMVVALLAIAGIVVGQQETPSPADVCQPDFIGDGVCDEVTNNREECGYDNGDCCECTCEGDKPGPTICISFECRDPDAECFTGTPTPSNETVATDGASPTPSNETVVTDGATPSPGVEATDDDDSSAPLVVSSPRAATIILGLAALFAILS